MKDPASMAQPIPGLTSHVLPLMLIWLHEDPVKCPCGHWGVPMSHQEASHAPGTKHIRSLQMVLLLPWSLSLEPPLVRIPDVAKHDSWQRLVTCNMRLKP